MNSEQLIRNGFHELIIKFERAQNVSVSMYGAGAEPICPESAPVPRTSGVGAAQKSGGSAALITGTKVCTVFNCSTILFSFRVRCTRAIILFSRIKSKV